MSFQKEMYSAAERVDGRAWQRLVTLVDAARDPGARVPARGGVIKRITRARDVA